MSHINCIKVKVEVLTNVRMLTLDSGTLIDFRVSTYFFISLVLIVNQMTWICGSMAECSFQKKVNSTSFGWPLSTDFFFFCHKNSPTKGTIRILNVLEVPSVQSTEILYNKICRTTFQWWMLSTVHLPS